jgi:hypothetical protein
VVEPIIERDEAVGLLSNVSNILETLRRIEQLLEDGDEPEEIDEG